MATIKVKQTTSRINCPKIQKKTLDALGLTKMNKVVEHEDNPTIRGLISKVHHLVTIVE
ncbi:50S ribosomal protein L30 [Petrimonas sulfuriphila]|jgi:large subunit ribosomal protein L30|uniref:50S ribosomal protein L30 n=1 Tax=Petrimonas TaxID=307628 RepID=UPI000E7EB9E6|nr:50S ribosomal protein L30 [Petrimonas sp.]HBG80429.1 50S ribosomal protein L30 [Porphyromonadaceae bacterium]HBK95411.1 50S ribosomal protein L30 [Porphyromonadaceae bacterium]HBU46451.1 50S ribosomal protein L30 [Porphyromonadaceae bacterium]HCF81689.1 50S ribosomal protein L30 [Porphyromonadaceae bacterium]